MYNKGNSYQRYGNFIINKSEPLGSGNFGQVWKGYLISPLNSLEPVAIKQSYNESQNIKQIEALQILNHPHIIQYRDYRISGNSVFMVMQLCEGGTLDDLLYRMQRHDTKKIISFYSQIISGIKFMYEKKILHRDIKPSNILVNKKNVIKIADFGSSKLDRSSQIKLKTLVGTPLFFSPELFQIKEGNQDAYTQKSEIWALGLILYYMFNYQYENPRPAERMKESLPWTGTNISQIYKNIKSKQLQFKKADRIPEEIKQIIRKMLKIDTQQRMSFEELFSISLFNKELSKYEQTYMNSLGKTLVTEQKTIIPINKEDIQWELLELLQRKDQEKYESQETEQCRLFYQLLITELMEIYDIKYYQLLFQLQYKYYQLTKDEFEKERIRDKYYERSDLFQKCLQQSWNPHGDQNTQKDASASHSTQRLAESKLISSFILPTPNQNLLKLSKSAIKQNLKKVLGLKVTGSIFQQTKSLIYFLYDLLTLITFEKSWDIKRKTNATMKQYKRMRSLVKIQNILSRIKRASETVQL